jgi:prolipoprotein diacylglyceryltransferase
VVPLSLVMAWWLDIPWAKLWDFIGGGILTGGFWIRLGCVFNGCCAGRETKSAFSACLHDTQGVRKRRIPVQFMEMAWWLLGAVIFFSLWSRALAPGSYALGVLAWYGFGRFWLEPLREKPDLLGGGKLKVNQLIAALLVLVGAGGLVLRAWLGI